MPNKLRINNYIGKSNWGGDSYFSGVIDEFRVYSRSLSSNEVYLIYHIDPS